MIIKTAFKLSIVCSALLLMSCDSLKNDNISSICKDSPELCVDFHKISDCRFKRTTVIRARYYDKIEPSEAHLRQLLAELDDYQSCLELTLFIQFTRNKERKKKQVENYLATQALLQEHLKESKGTKDPMLAYYLWTTHQDMQARETFLAVATADNVSDPWLLFKLAIIYAKDDPQKALNQFYKALHLTRSLDEISPSIFAMIMTIFYQNRQFEEAYIWALITKEADEEDEVPINLELILKKGILGGEKLIVDEKKLIDKAEYYYEKLEDGIFKEEVPLLK
jgi:hypothetical protein